MRRQLLHLPFSFLYRLHIERVSATKRDGPFR